MDNTQEKDYKQLLKSMIAFIEDLGISVKTNTKARGHQGFFLKDRIDISKQIDDKRKIEVLIHEFTHYVHSRFDSSVLKNEGKLEKIFPNSDIKRIEKELYEVTLFVEQKKALTKLIQQKTETCETIKELDEKIKRIYPDFKRSYGSKEIERGIKKTDAKYLLKYDRVQVKSAFLRKVNLYSISEIDKDFPMLSESEKNYIRLKSQQRMLKRISSRITKLNKYYKKPTELFARFIEGLFIDTAEVSEIAPHTYLVFCRELALNRFPELADFINNFF